LLQHNILQTERQKIFVLVCNEFSNTRNLRASRGSYCQ
jgi:hypothetical protein